MHARERRSASRGGGVGQPGGKAHTHTYAHAQRQPGGSPRTGEAGRHSTRGERTRCSCNGRRPDLDRRGDGWQVAHNSPTPNDAHHDAHLVVPSPPPPFASHPTTTSATSSLAGDALSAPKKKKKQSAAQSQAPPTTSRAGVLGAHLLRSPSTGAGSRCPAATFARFGNREDWRRAPSCSLDLVQRRSASPTCVR